MFPEWYLHSPSFKPLAAVCTSLEALYIDCSLVEFSVEMCHSPASPRVFLLDFVSSLEDRDSDLLIFYPVQP